MRPRDLPGGLLTSPSEGEFSQGSHQRCGLEGFGLRQVWVLVPAPLRMGMTDGLGQHPSLCEPVFLYSEWEQ